MERQFKKTSRSGEPAPPEDPPLPPPPAAAQALSSVLDDISDVLETDALTFVQNYRQKGGQ